MKALLTTTSVAVAAALALGVGPASVTKDAQAAWKPKKSVELVIMAGKGADIAKCSAELWMKKALTRNPMKMPMKPISSAGSSPDSSARR